ncbi:uncharacterized protein LOC114339310 [Diabrotica virgifera virgifera]|uniref:Uncharacterized protein LOC114339310 isoform X1 n=1 Tax=Diabrotica virgifera virgifera TaxID=50390 RepID=A0A6P7G9E5_DIAVI|nr:uncharacterized protein LOC114339310 [Diabrotica virgifera virgifera]
MEAITAYTYQEQQLVIKSAIRKQADKKKHEAILENHFNLRTNSIEGYFIRLSADSKKQYILQLLENLKSHLSLYQIFSVLSLGHAKMDFYSIVDPETNFVHEKLGLDHDRMLDKKTLKEAIATDLEWFATLDEHEQMNFTLHLIRIAGGSGKGSLYMPLYKIYKKTLGDFVKTHTYSKKSVIDDDSDDDDLILPEYDPKDPSSVEVEKQRKKWTELLNKYKGEVYPIPVASKIKLTKDEKNGKKKQKEKKPKKSKKDKKVKEESEAKKVTMFQLLPIWIVKKILCYLSNTDLVKLKKVNAYWSFVISEVLKERTTRLKLNDTLEKMKTAIDPEIFEKAMKEKSIPGQKIKHVFYELTATDKKLIPKETKNAQEKCLQRSANEDREDLDLPTGEFIPFPRYIKKEMELYRYRPCFLQDVGIKFDIDGEIEKQKSFLSYSLAKSLTSLKLSVQEDMLSGW